MARKKWRETHPGFLERMEALLEAIEERKKQTETEKNLIKR
jgi:hypothetical protein